MHCLTQPYKRYNSLDDIGLRRNRSGYSAFNLHRSLDVAYFNRTYFTTSMSLSAVGSIVTCIYVTTSIEPPPKLQPLTQHLELTIEDHGVKVSWMQQLHG